MKSNTRSPGIRRATQEAQRLGFAVRYVEFVPSPKLPCVIPPAGITMHDDREILVGTRDLSKPGAPPRCRRSIEAILRHELEHAGGAEFATDYPEFGLICGGTRDRVSLCTPDYAFPEESPITRRRYRVQLESVPGMYAQYDGHVDVWCDTDDWDDLFAAAVRELRRTSFPDRGAGAWRMVGFEPIA